jgi:hypothetical protein
VNIDDAREQCRVFAEALQARGYPPAMGVIVKELCKIDYSLPHLAPVLAWQNAPYLQHTSGLCCLKPGKPATPGPPPPPPA